jgi:phospholipid N-methyltransferase
MDNLRYYVIRNFLYNLDFEGMALMYRLFFQHFLRDPKNVGAILPISKQATPHLIKDLSQRAPNKQWNILEVGAGFGNISKEIAASMNPNDHLDLIEIDGECCEFLIKTFQKDSRLAVHCTSILDWTPSYKYDLIVSTLPLNSFSPEKVEKIIKHYQKISSEEARCSYVEYMGLEKINLFFGNQRTRQAISKRRMILNLFHQKYLLEKIKIFTSFLPCYVYHMKLHSSSH